jgi:hypothetical protein
MFINSYLQVANYYIFRKIFFRLKIIELFSSLIHLINNYHKFRILFYENFKYYVLMLHVKFTNLFDKVSNFKK